MNRPVPDIESGERTPRAAATAWFSWQRSGQMAKADQAALKAWLAEDPAHLEAYLAVREAWSDLGEVRAHPTVMALRKELTASQGLRRRRFVTGAIAACLLAGFLLLAWTAGWNWLAGPRPLADHTFVTALGERATIKLPDGSELTLNTDTVVRTRADAKRRLVFLDRGQVFVKVAKDPRHPFIVTAGDRTVTALGTAFDVRLQDGVFKVTLVEGRVRVEGAVSGAASSAAQPGTPAPASSSEAQATEMTAGTQLVAPEEGEWRLARMNTTVETSWTRGQLIFDGEPLRNVVEELNRYSPQKMIVPNVALANTPISGNFKPGDIDGFVHALEQFRLARSAVSADGAIELRPFS